MLAIQLFSLGILALQSKRYFEELFHLGTTIFKDNQGTGTYEEPGKSRESQKPKFSQAATPEAGWH